MHLSHVAWTVFIQKQGALGGFFSRGSVIIYFSVRVLIFGNTPCGMGNDAKKWDRLN